MTARKRAESTQDVPVAITAVNEQTIEKYDLTSLERLAASTPQFTVGRAGSGSGATLVLRGIGSNTTSIGLEQSVAVVVDSVYYGHPTHFSIARARSARRKPCGLPRGRPSRPTMA